VLIKHERQAFLKWILVIFMKFFPDGLETNAYLMLRDPRKLPYLDVTGRVQPMVPHAIATYSQVLNCLAAQLFSICMCSDPLLGQ